MQSKATSVEQYLAGLPDDRRAAIEAVRKVILENLDRDYEEGMQYGMIGYYVPHRVFPAGYHCDPEQPLTFAGIASQKNHMALYMMSVYGDDKLRSWFEKAYKASGKKLDMGKSCVRFKKLEDLPLAVITEAIAKVSVDDYVAQYEKIQAGTKTGKKAAAKAKAKVAAKTVKSKAKTVQAKAKKAVAKAKTKVRAAVARAKAKPAAKKKSARA